MVRREGRDRRGGKGRLSAGSEAAGREKESSALL